MLHIEFEYKDKYTNGKWNTQSCMVSSVEECKKIYGLGVDCEYRIISVKEVINEPKKSKVISIADFTDTYTVYDNCTDKVVTAGTWPEIEDYAECEGRYTVVSNANGMKMN